MRSDQEATQANVEAAGPWVTATQAAGLLGVTVDEVDQLHQDRRALAYRFADGALYYVVHQFRAGRIVDGLVEVLRVLATGNPSSQVAASWLSGPALDRSGRSTWEQLADGELDAVLEAARRDAATWSR